MLRMKERHWNYLATATQQARELQGLLWNRNPQVVQVQHTSPNLQAGTTHLHQPWNILWSSSPHHTHPPLLSGPHLASPHTHSQLLRFMRMHSNNQGAQSENGGRF
jgi:hypothetical protein